MLQRRQRLGTRTTYLVIAATTALAVLMRLPFLSRPPYPDEGGMLVVARHWHTGGRFLYGDLFLARPPLLLAFFRLAGDLGGIVAVRALGLGLVVLAVLSAAWAGSSLAGRRGAVTAAVVAAALLSDPELGTREIDAETVGLPLVLLSVALVLAGMRRTRGRAVLLAAGGACAVGALLCKQNLADGLAFGVVLVVATGLMTARRRQAVVDLGWFTAGVAVPMLATLLWLGVSGHSVSDFVYTLYGFRVDGGATMLSRPTASQGDRFVTLVLATVKSGLVPLLLVCLWLLRRRLLREPVVLALLAMLGTALVGIGGGGQFWIHYTLGLVAVTALLAARAVGRVRRPSRLLIVAVAATVVSSLVSTLGDLGHRPPADSSWTGGTTQWLSQVERPGDSMVVAYGEASLYETTGLRPAYPYIWTLPMRVRDPELTALKALLAGPRAPTFVLVPSPLNAWDIDPSGSVQTTIDQHYREVATVCGTPVYVVHGVDRTIPPAPTGCG